MSTHDNIGLLEEEALKRKERLKALKQKYDETGKEGDKSEDDNAEGMASLPRLVVIVGTWHHMHRILPNYTLSRPRTQQSLLSLPREHVMSLHMLGYDI
jgi:hypothetical protein